MAEDNNYPSILSSPVPSFDELTGGGEGSVAETDIAIIGMAGRFPCAANLEEFWQNLRNGRECLTVLSEEALLGAGVSPELFQKPNYVPVTATLAEHEYFDANFFGFSPREAQLTDPQHRLFLEQCWTVLESAGYDPFRYEGAIGVYGGIGMGTYLLQCLYPHLAEGSSLDLYQVQMRNDKDFLPTLVSYKLNLRGPSLSVQTACSTSLVAVHLASQGLILGDCDMAIAGGATVFAQQTGYLYTEGMILSPDGHCRAFDARAQGTVGGNGVGVVLLKRLEDALADRDTVYAVIKGSVVNNDGSRKVGYTAPSVQGQAAVIAEAQALAGVCADTIQYIETHGTGTALGDPVEIAALTQAFRRTTEKTQFCAIGSLKTNVGHLDTAAGVAGLIKVVLALHHREIPPSLNFETPNPAIAFEESPFFVNTQLRPWDTGGEPRRAGVSAFGIGGTNAHLIVEEPPLCSPEQLRSPEQPSPQRPCHLLLLSAKSETALRQHRLNLAQFLRQNPTVNLGDVAFTLAQGRSEMPCRWAAIASSPSQAIDLLETHLEEPGQWILGDRPFLIMGFPGQGGAVQSMGADLYRHESVFRTVVDHCAELLQPLLHRDIRTVLYPELFPVLSANGDGILPDRQHTLWVQPSLFVVEYALAQLWQDWGIQPDAMIGHSLGEYVVACLAGVFSLEDGLRLVVERARLMQHLPPGGMVAIPGTAEGVAPLLSPPLTLAATNGGMCTVTGPMEAIAQLEAHLIAQGQSITRLHTAHPFHSPLVEPMVPAFRQVLEQVNWQPPHQPYLSNVTGTWITAEEATDGDYWIRHLRQTVRFGEAIAQLLDDPTSVFLEVGPGRTLTALVRRHPNYGGHALLNSLPTERKSPERKSPERKSPERKSPERKSPEKNSLETEGESETKRLLHTLGQLWVLGANPTWSSFFDGELRYRISLPTYPFERQRYWIDPPKLSSRPSPDLAFGPPSLTPAAPLRPPLHPPLHQPSPSRSRRPGLVTTPYVAPQTSLETAVTEQWEQVLGISPIGLHDNFYELGGDSLSALSLLERLQQHLLMDIPATALLQTPTIAGLVSRVQNQFSQTLPNAPDPINAPNPTNAPDPINAPNSINAPNPTNAPDPTQAADPIKAPNSINRELTRELTLGSPLVIQMRRGRGGESKTLFFVHPIGGGIGCYGSLAQHLDPEWTFYGLQAAGIGGEGTDEVGFKSGMNNALPSLEAIAFTYLQALQRGQGKLLNPLFLGGWSMGGVVAYEMARQWIQGGGTVAGLILIDSPTPLATPHDVQGDFAVFARGLGFQLNQIQDLIQDLGVVLSLPNQMGKTLEETVKEPVKESLEEPLEESLEKSLEECGAIAPILQRLLQRGQQRGLLPSVVTLEYLQRVFWVLKVHSHALSHYTAQESSVPIPTLLLQASLLDQSLTGLFSSQDHNFQPRRVWQDLVSQPLMTQTIQGDHFSIVNEPQVSTVGKAINAFLNTGFRNECPNSDPHSTTN